MGGRDIPWRAKKKPKKGAKKAVGTTIPQPPATVDVVRKRRKAKEAEEE